MEPISHYPSLQALIQAVYALFQNHFESESLLTCVPCPIEINTEDRGSAKLKL